MAFSSFFTIHHISGSMVLGIERLLKIAENTQETSIFEIHAGNTTPNLCIYEFKYRESIPQNISHRVEAAKYELDIYAFR